jgi:putative NIF3 family GTP cyclohydrolase 1 type 2
VACKVKEIMTIMEDIAPSSEAEEWDNAGLLLGDKEAEVRRIMVTLDITGELMKEAAQKGVDMIVTHHPLLR